MIEPATLRELTACSSTNDEATAWARDPLYPAPHGAVVTATSQSAGRGRRGRVWHSTPGNLYMSVVLRPQLPLERLAPISLCAGIAIVEALDEVGVTAGLKWPNDVLVDGKKIAGVLVESSGTAEPIEVVVGVGINVAQVEFSAGLVATSVALILGATADAGAQLVERLRNAVAARLCHWVAELEMRPETVNPAWLRRWVHRGATMQTHVGASCLTGVARGLSPSGALLLEGEAGIVEVVAGDVVVVT